MENLTGKVREILSDIPAWKLQDRALARRARAAFGPGRHGIKGDPFSEVMSLSNGTGKLPTYYIRPKRTDKDGAPATPTLPWRKVL